ncbi:hypothetical protein Dda_9423 [Drechslerella dactyloides]|uniref:Uncharacterized protein n=1 Tax=Drechslerella dactyloides TaxID=74499 RepID=A0AAD6IP90_DREDA|nr:hypothetical protein Dda_9423 [Drechslerella dactyloides]
MIIKAATIISLAAAVSAAPAGAAKSDIEARGTQSDAGPGPGPFSFLALRSASPIHFGSLNASGLKIWIGKPTESYCPVDPKFCPPGNVTAFFVDNTASMSVSVPGGQQVYIDPKGALSYTQAHSAAIPPGSITTCFRVMNSPNDNNILFFSNGEGDFVACPVAPETGPYQVFVNIKGGLKSEDVPSGNTADCLGFTAAGGPAQEQVSAWQYT